MRHSLEEGDARRLLGGRPVTLVTTSWRGNWDAMPAIFVTPLSIEATQPSHLGVAAYLAGPAEDR